MVASVHSRTMCVPASPRTASTRRSYGGDDHFAYRRTRRNRRARLDLRAHVAGRKVPLGVVAAQFGGRDASERPLVGLLVVQADALGVGRDDEQVGAELRCEQRRRAILVDDGLDTAQAAAPSRTTGMPPPPTAMTSTPSSVKPPDDALLDDLDRLGRRHDAPVPPRRHPRRCASRTASPPRLGLARRVERADGLGRTAPSPDPSSTRRPASARSRPACRARRRPARRSSDCCRR